MASQALPPSRSYALVTCLLLGLGLVLAAYPLLHAFHAFEIDYNEGWNGYQQWRAARGEPLYSGLGPYWFNNYPPLSFYIVGWLGNLTGDVVLAGRLLSLAGYAAMALACGQIVRSAGGTREDGRLAAASCLLLFAVFATDYLGMNDPQLMGMGFAMWGLALYLGASPSPRRAACAALLLALAGLIKHNLALLPLLVTLHLLWRGEARRQIAFVAAAATCAVIAIALIWLCEGPAFFAQVLAPREWAVERAFLFATEIGGTLQAPLFLAGIGLFAARREAPSGLILAWMIAALVLGVYFAGGAGTAINIWFDLFPALSIGAGLVIGQLRQRGGSAHWQAAFALAINAGVLSQTPLALGRFGVDALGEMAESDRKFADDVAYLKAIPGPAICESQLLCLRAGKPMFFDSFNVLEARRTGRLPADAFAALLRNGDVAVVQVSSTRQHRPDDAAGQQMPARFINFEDSDFAALEREYRLDRTGMTGRFFVPRASR